MKLQWLVNKFKTDNGRIKAAVIIGAAGMLMIMLSEFIPENNDESQDKDITIIKSDENDDFRKQTERELKKLLEQIDGVGKCEVMISLESSTEYIYAENISRSSDVNADRRNEKTDEEIVITECNGERKPLVRKIIDPQIGGVVIVCEGGGDISINERVQKTVSTALNISSTRVCVEAGCR